MQQAVLFYVSGHGFGHARRAAEVMRALALLRPDAILHVRTAAPREIFSEIAGVRYSTSTLDSGAVEEDALRIDPDRTLKRAAELLRHCDEVIASEVAFVREERISLIVSDIPFLAGDIARTAGVPCFALGNFTWDWIYEPYLARLPEYEGLVKRVRESYSLMPTHLRLPFAHENGAFPEVVDSPLVVKRSSRPRQEVIRRLQADLAGARARVLIGMRGGVSHSALASAAENGKDFLFLVAYDVPGGMPENVRHITLTSEMSFTDAVGASDVVISKLGYGILADCIAAKTALLWPRRTGFREDDITEVEAPRYIRMREMPLTDFHAGDWSGHLNAVLQMPASPEEMRIDGAEFCAGIISERLGEDSSP